MMRPMSSIFREHQLLHCQTIEQYDAKCGRPQRGGRGLIKCGQGGEGRKRGIFCGRPLWTTPNCIFCCSFTWNIHHCFTNKHIYKELMTDELCADISSFKPGNERNISIPI